MSGISSKKATDYVQSQDNTIYPPDVLEIDTLFKHRKLSQDMGKGRLCQY